MNHLRPKGGEPCHEAAAAPEERSLRRRRFQLLDILADDDADLGDWSGGAANALAEWTLSYAASVWERTVAIKLAMALGMPLVNIQEYLDWIDARRPRLDQ